MKTAKGLNETKETVSGLIRNRLSLTLSFFLVLVFCGMYADSAHSQGDIVNQQPVLRINEGDEWYYFKGVQEPPQDWNRIDYDARNWQSGPTSIGYGTNTSYTVLDDMKGKYATVYARREFHIDNQNGVKGMNLSVLCDGPFIAYLNGVEMLRTKTVQISSPEEPLTLQDTEQYNVSGFRHELTRGKNVLAVQCDNDDINSEAFSFIPAFEVLEKWGGQ